MGCFCVQHPKVVMTAGHERGASARRSDSEEAHPVAPLPDQHPVALHPDPLD